MTAAERLRGGIGLGALGRRLIRLVIVVAVLGAAGTGIWWYFFKDDSKPAQSAALTEIAVTKGRLVSTLATTGTAQSTLTSKLTFLGSGQVRTISVKVGDSVTSGQELARLDDRDAQRKLDTAKSNLDSAQIRLNQLTEPATAADLAAAQQAVASSKTSLANAQANLDKATRGPLNADVVAADASVQSSDASVQSAKNSVETAKNAVQTAMNGESSARGALLTAQRTYCQSNQITVFACTESDVPLSDQMSRDLQAWIQNPTSGSPAQVLTATQNASAFLSANTAYINAKNAITTAQGNVIQAQTSVDTAQKALDSAKARRQALFDPPTDTDLAQMQSSIVSAQAGIVSAQARLDLLIKGVATANDIALQEQSVKLSQISYQTALDGLDNLVLHAPFDGIVGAIPINVGDQVGAATAAVTLSSPTGVRVDLTVSESDLVNLHQGLFAIATFDALPGSTYLLKISAVSNAPTVTQGVTTFAVQGQILRTQADLAANAADLQKIGAALQSLGGARGGTGGTAGATGAGAAGGQPGAGATRPAGQAGGQGQGQGQGGASRTPGAGGSPAAGATPGGAGGAGASGGGLAAAAANQPIPTPGMNANVIVLVNILEDQLLLPTTAVRRQGRQAFVYVKGPDGKPLQKNITVSGADATNTGIATGLAEGDMVLVGTVIAPGRRDERGDSGAALDPRRWRPVIKLESLSKIYHEGQEEEVRALDSVDLDIARGEFVAIMGTSGSGKSTMMNILGLLDQPTHGRYLFEGKDVGRMSDDDRAGLRSREFGFVFQQFNLLARMSAIEQVELPMVYQHRSQRRRLAKEALIRVGLGERMNHRPTELSGGQQQRVAIARALVVDPHVVFADEPTGALDSHTSEEVMGILENLVREQGITVILVTHEQDVADYADRIVRMRDGHIIDDSANPLKVQVSA